MSKHRAEPLRPWLPDWLLGLRRSPHTHAGYFWDNYYEHCKCGVSAGSRINPETGLRYITFSQWPEEARQA